MSRSTSTPLKLLALSAAGILLGIGLCSAHRSDFDGPGIAAVLLSAGLGAIALIWLVIALILNR